MLYVFLACSIIINIFFIIGYFKLDKELKTTSVPKDEEIITKIVSDLFPKGLSKERKDSKARAISRARDTEKTDRSRIYDLNGTPFCLISYGISSCEVSPLTEDQKAYQDKEKWIKLNWEEFSEKFPEYYYFSPHYKEEQKNKISVSLTQEELESLVRIKKDLEVVDTSLRLDWLEGIKEIQNDRITNSA